jgi:hypothetical protein
MKKKKKKKNMMMRIGDREEFSFNKLKSSKP